MRVIIEGDLPQVVAACAEIAGNDRAAKAKRAAYAQKVRLVRRASRESQMHLAARRKAVYAAYLVALHNKDDDAVSEFAHALSGRLKLTADFVAKADAYVASRGRK